MRGKGREVWVVNFYYPLKDTNQNQIFSANSYELFLALQSIISDLREFWDKEGDDNSNEQDSMKPGALIPKDTQDRLQWLYRAGSVSVTRDNTPWSRNDPWLVKVEIGAMPDSWVEKEGRDIHRVLGDTIEGVRQFWANKIKGKTDESDATIHSEDVAE
jgi:hypothetical protein